MKHITLTPPNASLFAGVQVDVPDPEGRDGRRIVGAAPAFRMENRGTDDQPDWIMLPLPRVQVACALEHGDAELRAVWAYEDSTVPNEETTVSLDARASQVSSSLA